MTTYARILNNIATDVNTVLPEKIFHPDVAAMFTIVPDGTQNGDVKLGSKWMRPAPPEAVIIENPITEEKAK